MPDRAPPAPPSPGRLALPVAFIYAAFAAAWIVYSDRLLAIWFRDPELLTRMQTYKGMAFVVVTSLGLWWLVRAGFAQQGRMRAQLSQSERDWRAMFIDSPLPIWVCARDGGRMLAANDAAARHYGYTRPEFMTLSMADLERMPAAAAAAPPPVAAAGVQFHYRRGGERIEVEVLARDTEFGGCAATLVLIHDVSARARIERRLAASEARLRLAMHATGLGLWDYAVGCDTVEGNEEVARMLGRAPEVFTESRATWAGRVHPDDSAAVRERFRAYLAGEAQGYCSEFRMRNDHGAYRWFRSVGQIVERDAAGHPARVIGTYLDITAQVAARQGLEGARRLLQQVVDSSPDWIFVKDPEHRFLMVNGAFAAARGVRPADMVGRPDSDFWPAETCEGDAASGRRGLHEDDRDALAGRTVRNGADLVTDVHGRRRLVETVKAPLVDPDGHIVGVLGYAHDVTERAAALARLSDLSGRLLGVQEEERRHLARELHDEIGQQLTALTFNLHALAREGASERARERIADCRAIVEHTLGSIRERVLDLRPPMLDDAGLGPAVQWYCRRQGERAGVPIVVAGAEALGRCGERVETVAFRTIQEAVNNALRHGAPGEIRVRLGIAGNDLTVSVDDDGTGFADEAPAAERRGLGLTGMRERVSLAGGTVEIASSAGAGTRVRAILPLAPDAPP